jgi:hypothetical protein
LSTHFVSIRDPSRSALASKTIDTVSETYALGKAGAKSSLEATPYGQQALMLDYMGGLSDIGKRAAGFRVFGPSNEEFDEDEDT